MLENEYKGLFRISNSNVDIIHMYCSMVGDKNEMFLMFIDEKPYTEKGKTWYCLKEIGKGVNGDWHWFTLDQLMICE